MTRSGKLANGRIVRRKRRRTPRRARRLLLAWAATAAWVGLGLLALFGRTDPLPALSRMSLRVDLPSPQALHVPDLNLSGLSLRQLGWPEFARPSWLGSHHWLPADDWLRVYAWEPFLLDRVNFVGLQKLRAPDLARMLELAPRTPLVSVDPGTVCARLRAERRIAACEAIRVPLDRLVIALRERVPVAAAGEPNLGISADGTHFRIEPEEAAKLPMIEGNPRIALRWVSQARQQGIDLSRVDVISDHEVALWPTGSRLRVVVETDPIESLRLYAEIEASGALGDSFDEHGSQELDLRFAGHPVLRKLASDREEGGEG